MTQEELDALMNGGMDDLDEEIEENNPTKENEEMSPKEAVSTEFENTEKIDPANNDGVYPPPATEDHQVVSKLDEVTKDSEEKASEILDIMDEISNTMMENEENSNTVLNILEEQKTLFEKLSNYTNKESLRDVNSINLEWSKDEIFGFFFKVVFAYTNEEFFEIMKIYNGENEKFIKPIKNEISKKNRYNQVPLEKYYLMPLVETFFGKYAYVGKNEFKRKMFGLMYDWFYNNLKNADDTISLRPFLDLIKEAIKRYLDSNNFDKFEKPILPAIFHTNKEVRKIAVKRHFEDLASEAGNEDFRKIIEHIQNTASSFPKKFRKRILEGKIYEEFLEYLFNNLDLNVKNVNQIEEILIINGVIKVDFIRSNYKKAEFAFLYKYYLGLEG